MNSKVKFTAFHDALRFTLRGNRAISSRYVALALSLCCGVVTTPSANAGLLISADFGPQITSPHDFSGVESDAAVANVAFSNANVWNALRVSDFSQPTTTNPTFNGLKDSAGNATGVNFSITGSINGFDFPDFFGSTISPVDFLRHDMFFFVGRSTTSTIDWVISGLVANAEYRFYAYGTRADAARLFDMLVDTNGDGLLTDESSLALGSTGSDTQHYQDAYFTSVFADATGVIHGRGVGRGATEANWSGFQLAQVDASTVPEPSTLALFGLAMLGLRASKAASRRPRNGGST
jgi:hypothetical protein